MQQHDLTGLKCPMPIVKLNRIIKEMEAEATCIVTADDPAFEPDVQAWCRKTGHELISCEKADGNISATIRKQADEPAGSV